MGDPAGVGPEVVLKALRNTDPTSGERYVVLGDKRVLDRTAGQLGLNVPWEIVSSAGELAGAKSGLVLFDFNNVPPGLKARPSVGGGHASLDYIHGAIDMALAGQADAVATAPVNKIALALAGCEQPGHTEIFAERTATRDFVMMLATPSCGASADGESCHACTPLRVVLATTHIALRNVFAQLTAERIATTIRVTARGLRELFGIEQPRIAVAALNPHAGDGGRFGSEESEIIAPAIESANAEGITCTGPIPPDTVFHRALAGQFDAVVVMYHDQGLIPIKTFFFDMAVNVTLGLPVIRTSADHGTAYDIAGKGEAGGGSMFEAIRMAAQIARRRNDAAGSKTQDT